MRPKREPACTRENNPLKWKENLHMLKENLHKHEKVTYQRFKPPEIHVRTGMEPFKPNFLVYNRKPVSCMIVSLAHPVSVSGSCVGRLHTKFCTTSQSKKVKREEEGESQPF